MSGSEEILSRLNPGSGDLEMTPAATGDRLTPADVAQAVSLIEDKIGALLLLIRVADQWNWLDELEERVRDDVRDHADDAGWTSREPRSRENLIRLMTRLAVFEHCVPKRCGACKGRGKRFPRNGPVRDCDKCAATGRTHGMSERGRAGEIGIDHRAWARTWSPRYAWIRRMLVERDRIAVDQLRRVMRSGG